MKDASELINLLYEPMDSDVIINLLDVLKLPQPMIDEQYYEDREIALYGEELVGINFYFEEVDNISLNGIPVLTTLSFYPHSDYYFKYDITMGDSYEDIVRKSGQHPPYRHKLVKKNRIWVFTREDGKEYTFSVLFSTSELTAIHSISIDFFTYEEDKNMLISLENENDTI